MSEPLFPPGPPMPPLPDQRRGCLQVLAVLIGGMMLLPGICAIIIVSIDPGGAQRNPNTLATLLTVLLVGAGGIALIWWAVKRPR